MQTTNLTNKEIAKKIQYLGDIMELHGENPYKVKSYQNAYLSLRKLPEPLSEMTGEQIESIKGIGKTISGNIKELLITGQISAVNNYEKVTPEGVRDMLQVRGFGPKKIKVIWKELGVESIGELLYACNENRLVELNGFGVKTQDDLKQKLEYFLNSKGQYLYAELEAKCNKLLSSIKKILPEATVNFVGEVRRKCNVVESIKLLIHTEDSVDKIFDEGLLQKSPSLQEGIIGFFENDIPIEIINSKKEEYGSNLFNLSGSEEFLKVFYAENPGIEFSGLEDEYQIFEKAHMEFVIPELREDGNIVRLSKNFQITKVIEEQDIRGVIHIHTTYSDGIHSIYEMASFAKDLGYEYIGVTDHSKSAFYANGLKEEDLIKQWEEIERLNQEFAPFHIFKGIESDILSDGSLDYDDEILSKFDFIIASVHSNLKMDENKATQRIIKAIENPFTNILGHPTGRLLLSRQGYPVDLKKVIEACSANNVAIELNANPYRLDMDWRWLRYAMEKEVLISINPDAHSMSGIKDIHYGVLSARKGGLAPHSCLTVFGINSFRSFIQKKGIADNFIS